MGPLPLSGLMDPALAMGLKNGGPCSQPSSTAARSLQMTPSWWVAPALAGFTPGLLAAFYRASPRLKRKSGSLTVGVVSHDPAKGSSCRSFGSCQQVCGLCFAFWECKGRACRLWLGFPIISSHTLGFVTAHIVFTRSSGQHSGWESDALHSHSSSGSEWTIVDIHLTSLSICVICKWWWWL